MHKWFWVSWVSPLYYWACVQRLKLRGVETAERGLMDGCEECRVLGATARMNWGEQRRSDTERRESPPKAQPIWPPSYTSSVFLALPTHLFFFAHDAWLMPAKRQMTINGVLLCHLNVCAFVLSDVLMRAHLTDSNVHANWSWPNLWGWNWRTRGFKGAENRVPFKWLHEGLLSVLPAVDC